MVDEKKKKLTFKAQMPADGEVPKTIKIEHHRSPHFSSHFATNAILSGPSADGMYHLIFHAEAIGIKSETGELIEEEVEEYEKGVLASYKTKIQYDDLETFREDKTRITMPLQALLALRDLLNRQHPPSDMEAEVESEKDGES